MSRSSHPARSRALSVAAVVFVLAIAGASLLTLTATPAAAAPAAPYFGPNVRINGNPTYYASQPSLAVGSDGVIYLAFASYTGPTSQWDIFFTKSADGGRTWRTPVRVNNDAGNAGQGDPDLALGPNDDIYIVWSDGRGGTTDVYFARSTNGGVNFPSNARVNDVTTFSQDSGDMAVDNLGIVHAVWTDYRDLFSTGADIYYANSTDGGLSFNPSRRVNDVTASEQVRPAIAVANDRTLYAVWDDPRNGARGRDIYFSKSTDLGATWQPNVPVNDDTGNVAQQDAAIAVDEAGTIYLVWSDYRGGPTAPDIYASRSTNAGASFAANVKVNDDTGAAVQVLPQLAVRAGHLVAIWADGRTAGSTSYDIYVASSADGIAWGGNVRANDDAQNIYQNLPTVAVDAVGNIFTAFYDARTTGTDVYAATLDVVPPTATASPGFAVDQGVPASFDGSGSSDNFAIASYSWDFGDGTSAAGAAASHAYAQPGLYTATLTVWDYSGNAASDSVLVTVRDTQAPAAYASGDRVVDEGHSLYFDGSASTDNVGVTAYEWDFGDGTSAAGATANHAYGPTGTYTVTLTVRDAAGNEDTATFEVAVRGNELAARVGLLTGLVAALAIALAIVGYMAFAMWRRRRPAEPMPSREMPGGPPPHPPTPPSPPPREMDPLDMPLYEEPPKGP